MSASRLSAVLLAMALLLPAVPAAGLTDEERAGGWSGLLPSGIDVGLAPDVEVKNLTIALRRGAEDSEGRFDVTLTNAIKRNPEMSDLNLTLELYRYAMIGVETDISSLPIGNRPMFWLPYAGNDTWGDAVTVGPRISLLNDSLAAGTSWTARADLRVPSNATCGFYRIRLSLTYTGPDGTTRVARSRGHFTDAEWSTLLESARTKHNFTIPVSGVNGLLPEAGFTVAPPMFDYISRPNKVPDFGNFTTPVIRPGGSGKYNFTISNRYAQSMTDVRLEVSLYMWATLEESKAIDGLKGPKPRLEDGGTTMVRPLGNISSGGRAEPSFNITTSEDTPKGTYFVRHRLTFTYNGTEYTMASRGYFTAPQWEGFDYGNLYYQLNVSGIVPDSSISVKDPVPLWPLALLVGLCVLFGALAVVFYLAEEHGAEYPRLKKALQYWTGKLEQRRRLMQQRLDELRREVDVPLEDDEP